MNIFNYIYFYTHKRTYTGVYVRKLHLLIKCVCVCVSVPESACAY